MKLHEPLRRVSPVPPPGRRVRAALSGGALLAIALIAGCSAPHRAVDWVSVREITPRGLDSLEATTPAVAADAHGRMAVTWVTRGGRGRDAWLSISRDSGATFTAPSRLNPLVGSVSAPPEGRPLATFGPSGALAVVWTERRPDVAGGVDVMVRASSDGGVTLGPPVCVNDDRASGRPVYHGFPALAFRDDGSLFAAWLDERHNAATGVEPVASALYAARSLDGGQTWSTNAQLVDSACSCCRPAVVTGGDAGIAVAYRSARSNLRDPALIVSLDGGATFARDTIVSADHWYLEMCPDIGPVLTWNRDPGGHYAWFTGAGEPGVYLLSWRPDHGAAGLRRALADSLAFASHPRLAALGPTTLIGVEARPRSDTTRTVLAVRGLEPDGSLTPWAFLGADATQAWLAAVDEHSAAACWVENDGTTSRVRVVRLVHR